MNFLCITFDDGSCNYVEAQHYDHVRERMILYAETRVDECIELRSITQGHMICYVSKIQDVFLSTPETRNSHREIDNILQSEKGWAE